MMLEAFLLGVILGAALGASLVMVAGALVLTRRRSSTTAATK